MALCPARREEHVRGLEIAMDDLRARAPRRSPRTSGACSRTASSIGSGPWSSRCFARSSPSRYSMTMYGAPSSTADIDHARDVLAADLRGGARLAREALDDLRVEERRREQELDCDLDRAGCASRRRRRPCRRCRAPARRDTSPRGSARAQDRWLRCCSCRHPRWCSMLVGSPSVAHLHRDVARAVEGLDAVLARRWPLPHATVLLPAWQPRAGGTSTPSGRSRG